MANSASRPSGVGSMSSNPLMMEIPLLLAGAACAGPWAGCRAEPVSAGCGR